MADEELLLRSMCALQQRLDRLLPAIRGGDPRTTPPREGLSRLWDFPANRLPVLIAPAGAMVVNLVDEAGVVEAVPQGALGVIAGIGVQTDQLAGTRLTAYINGVPHRTYRNIVGWLPTLATPTADFLPIDLIQGDRFGVLVENITLPAININVAVRILGWYYYPEA